MTAPLPNENDLFTSVSTTAVSRELPFPLKTGIGKWYKFCLIPGLLLSFSLASAQYIDREPTLDGVLRPSSADNFQWDHSFSVSAISSSAGFSSRSLYLSHLTWQLAAPLQLKLDMGLLRDTRPLGVPGGETPRLIGGGELLWRPTDNTIFRLSIHHGPCQNYGWRQTPGFMNYDNSAQQ